MCRVHDSLVQGVVKHYKAKSTSAGRKKVRGERTYSSFEVHQTSALIGYRDSMMETKTLRTGCIGSKKGNWGGVKQRPVERTHTHCPLYTQSQRSQIVRCGHDLLHRGKDVPIRDYTVWTRGQPTIHFRRLRLQVAGWSLEGEMAYPMSNFSISQSIWFLGTSVHTAIGVERGSWQLWLRGEGKCRSANMVDRARVLQSTTDINEQKGNQGKMT